jgi:hypothetical protein
MRIGVLGISQIPHVHQPKRFVSKNAAAALVRRLLAIKITKHLIQMVEVAATSEVPVQPQSAPHKPPVYEHHIEPKFKPFGFADTEWLRWMNGANLPPF